MSADYYVKGLRPTLRLGDAERILDATLAAAAFARHPAEPAPNRREAGL